MTSTSLKNFTLSLISFHTCRSFTNPNAELEGSKLWESLIKLGENYLPFPALKNLRSALICYPDQKNYSIKPLSHHLSTWLSKSGILELGSLIIKDNLEIIGDLQPFIFNDTYISDLTISPKTPENLDIETFKQLNFSALWPQIEASLGQTIGIYGETNLDDSECEELAQKYADALVFNTSFKLSSLTKDYLFGSLAYEYEIIDSQNPHRLNFIRFLIIINNQYHARTVKILQEKYDELLNFFCIYHKLNHIYRASREAFKNSQEIYKNLDRNIQDFSAKVSHKQNRLNHLKIFLEILPQDYLNYTQYLRDIKTHQVSFATNLINYQQSYEKLSQSGKPPNFWHDFQKQAILWQKQLEIDLNYLTPGQDLFATLINTSRGMVEIDQAESDRSLERTIQILGVGIGAGGIAASGTSAYIEKTFTLTPKSNTDVIHPGALTLILSFAIGFTAALIVWLITGGYSQLLSHLQKYLTQRSHSTDRSP